MRTQRSDAGSPHGVFRDEPHALEPTRPEDTTPFTRLEVNEPSTVAPFVGASVLGHGASADASFERAAKALETWEQLERAHPAVAAKVPGFCRTPEAKLLFVVADRELSKVTGPLSVTLGAHDSIRRNASGHLELRTQGREPLLLKDREGDFARLLEGAQRHAARGTGPYDAMPPTVEALLAGAVRDFYSNPAFSGGGLASSERGGRAFRYATFEQVLVSSDPSQRGFECLASAAFHLYRSMGLVPPDGSRESLERRYTVIHGDDGSGGPRLGRAFTRSLRGGPPRAPGERRLDAQATAAFANELRETDWAKLTGAAKGRYAVRTLGSTDELEAHFARGGAGVRTTWADGGHYFVLSGARRENGVLTVDSDDSLRRASPPRTATTPRPHRTEYHPAWHTRFWTLARTDPIPARPL